MLLLWIGILRHMGCHRGGVCKPDGCAPNGAGARPQPSWRNTPPFAYLTVACPPVPSPRTLPSLSWPALTKDDDHVNKPR